MNADTSRSRRQFEREKLTHGSMPTAERADEPVARADGALGERDRSVTSIACESPLEPVRLRVPALEVVRSGNGRDPVWLGSMRVADPAEGHGASLVVARVSACAEIWAYP